MTRRLGVPAGLVVLLGAALAALPSFYVSLLDYIGLYAMVGVGLVLLTGCAGLTSFGQAAFVGIGAYATAMLSTRFALSPWLGLPVAMALAGLAALVLGAIALRMSGHYLILGTMAWGIALYYMVGNIDALGGQNGIADIPPLVLFGAGLGGVRASGALIWTVLLLSLWGTSNLLDSRPGRAIRALRNSELARAFGVRTGRLRLAVFVYAALLAAVAGWMQAHFLRFVSPMPFSMIEGFNFVFMLVIGGSAHLLGAVLGPAVFVLLQTALQALMAAAGAAPGQYEQIVFGLLIILLLHRAPGGVVAPVLAALRRAGWPAAVPAVAPSPHALPSRPVPPRSGDVLLRVENVSKSFGGLKAVGGVSLEVGRGEIVALIGPNGAGKSTLFNLISGQLAMDSGTVRFDGRAIEGQPPEQIAARGLARTFQHVQLVPGMSLLESTALGTHIRGRRGMLAAALRLSRLEERDLLGEAAAQLDRIGLGSLLTADASQLALGQQRLAEIARALCADPLLLLLDEPAAGLRFGEKRELGHLLGMLRHTGLSMLIVEHDMEFVMGLADRVVVVDFGVKLSEGVPAAVQSDPKVIEAYLGAEL